MIARQKINLFETIQHVQHDLDFEPYEECIPTGAPPGSLEKIQVMCERLAKGQDMHHPNDANGLQKVRTCIIQTMQRLVRALNCRMK